MPEESYFSGKSKLGKQTISWESVFPKGMTYNCERCGLCCNQVYLNQKDAQKLMKRGLEDLIEVKKEGPFGNEQPYMKTRKNGTCVALDDDWLCSIYPKRPTICRNYPFIINPGMDGNIIVDISLRCPYVGMFSSRKIGKKLIEDNVALTIKSIRDVLKGSLLYRNTLAEHIRASYAIAFMPRERRIDFMDSALEQIRDLHKPVNLIYIMEEWARKISSASRDVLSGVGQDFFRNKKHDRNIIRKAIGLRDREYVPLKKRWSAVFGDLGNNLFLLGKNGIEFKKVNVAKGGVSINDKDISWDGFGIPYSQEALELLSDYMKLNVRRAGFELTVAKMANYLLDYKNKDIIDYELSSFILSRAFIRHIDPVAKLLAATNKHKEVSGSDMRLAICNLDSLLLMALMTGVLVEDFIQKLETDPELIRAMKQP
jgi:Fe-S-cluster containining protein